MVLQTEEWEALEAVFEDAVFSNANSVILQARPRTAGVGERQFVSAKIEIIIPDTYPEAAPRLCLQNVVGLDDRRQAEMMSHLDSLRQELVGDFMLGPLCEAALEWISINNWPDGAILFASAVPCKNLMLRQSRLLVLLM